MLSVFLLETWVFQSIDITQHDRKSLIEREERLNFGHLIAQNLTEFFFVPETILNINLPIFILWQI